MTEEAFGEDEMFPESDDESDVGESKMTVGGGGGSRAKTAAARAAATPIAISSTAAEALQEHILLE